MQTQGSDYWQLIHSRYDYTQLDDANRQRVIAHSWDLIVLLLKYLWAGIVVWELKIKNVLNAFGSFQLRYKQLQALMGD